MGRIKDTKLRSSSESVSVQNYNDYMARPIYISSMQNNCPVPIALSIVFTV